MREQERANDLRTEKLCLHDRAREKGGAGRKMERQGAHALLERLSEGLDRDGTIRAGCGPERERASDRER